MPRKYTRGAVVYSDKSKKLTVDTGCGKGWSREGILCFNELFDQVSKDRLAHPEFVKIWLEEDHECQVDGKTKKQYK